MLIDLDIGNTRAKWRVTQDGEIVDRGVISTYRCDWSPFSALKSYQPKRVRVSNVAGEVVANKVSDIVETDFGILGEFAFSCQSVGLVTSGYDEPECLGVDRWMAILAGWDLFHDRCIVIDAGSALTLDFMDCGGRHLGGYIVPGQEMMCDALFGGTSGIGASSSEELGLDFGANTGMAVRNGCYAMALGLIEKVMAEGSKDRAPMNIVLTGGDAGVFLPHLPKTVLHKPDLVLDGLALALP